MTHTQQDFEIKNGELHCEEIPLSQIAAEVGTPAYIYSRAALLRQCERILKAFGTHPVLPCFAVKANGNLSILREISSQRLGADVVSVGEMERALKAGIPPSRIVFSGVGKTAAEIEYGLERGILSFNVESVGELSEISRLAKKANKVAPVAIRVNPNVDARTNPYIATGLYSTKFGIAENEVMGVVESIQGDSSLRLLGLSCHIGSQITSLSPFRETAKRMRAMSESVRALGFKLEFVDLGGGLGIRYDKETPPTIEEYAKVLLEEIAPLGLRILIEPGRLIAGNMGVLLTKVLYLKTTAAKNFVIVDAAMNDLIRPSLYEAYHAIEPVKPHPSSPQIKVDVVGPICESGDFFAQEREMPKVQSGDLLAVRSCGAYAASMASNYNTRPRAPEVLVEKDQYRIVRKRETLSDLWREEL